MEILLQIRPDLSKAVQGTGIPDRLKEVFDRAAGTESGVMRCDDFYKAISYPLRGHVVTQIYDRYFASRTSNTTDELTREQFLAGICKLEQRADRRFDTVLDFHQDESGRISFSSVKRMLAVMLMQCSIVLSDTSLTRLTSVVLRSDSDEYTRDEVKALFNRWHGLASLVAEIISPAIFLAPRMACGRRWSVPKKPPVTHRSTGLIFWCLTCYAVTNLLCVTGVALTSLESAGYTGGARLATHDGNDHWNATFADTLRRIRQPVVSDDDAAALRSVESARRDNNAPLIVYAATIAGRVVVEHLNLHLLLVTLSGLRALQVLLRRSPLCHHLRLNEARRMCLWLNAAVGVLVFADCALNMFFLYAATLGSTGYHVLFLLHDVRQAAVTTLSDESALIDRLRTILILNVAGSLLKCALLAGHLVGEMCVRHKQVAQLRWSVLNPSFCAVAVLHLVQYSSFIKWCFFCVLFMLADHVTHRNRRNRPVIGASKCTTAGALILDCSRAAGMAFRPGDFVLVSVDEIDVDNAVPAWIISSPVDESELSLLLVEDEAAWLPRKIRHHLQGAHELLQNHNASKIRTGLICGPVVDGSGGGTTITSTTTTTTTTNSRNNDRSNSSGVDRASRKSIKTSWTSLVSLCYRKKVDVIVKDCVQPWRQNAVFIFSDTKPHPEAAAAAAASYHPDRCAVWLATSFSLRLEGPFNGVQFDRCSRYRHMMFLVTAKSVGAIAAFLDEQSRLDVTPKITVILTSPFLCGIEWFIEKLVHLELRRARRPHDFHFRIYLTAVDRSRDVRLLLASLAVAVMVRLHCESDADFDVVNQACQQIIVYGLIEADQPEKRLMMHNTGKIDFEDVGFVLCDTDFAYTDLFLPKLDRRKTRIELRNF